MRVTEIMQAPVQTIASGESAGTAWERMRQAGIHHLVVLDEGVVVGAVSAGDLGGPHGGSLRAGRTVGALMNGKVPEATTTTTVREAANLMRGHGVDCLPIFRQNTLKGIITAHDLLDLIGRGADRPVAKAERRTLKNRGEKPRQDMAATRLAGARIRVGRFAR